MSTRATILYGKNWHIYDELLDDTIYIEFKEGSVEISFPLMSSEEFSKGLRNLFQEWRNEQKARDAQLRIGADDAGMIGACTCRRNFEGAIIKYHRTCPEHGTPQS